MGDIDTNDPWPRKMTPHVAQNFSNHSAKINLTIDGMHLPALVDFFRGRGCSIVRTWDHEWADAVPENPYDDDPNPHYAVVSDPGVQSAPPPASRS